MGRYKLEDLSLDPFVIAMDQADDLKPIPEKFAAGWLSLAPTLLQEWRSSGRTPPQFIKITDKKVVYPMGELRRFMRELLEKARAADAERAVPNVMETSSAAETLANITGAKDSKALGLDQTIMRGGRRKGVKQSSFIQFMAEGQSDDEWVFAMIPDASRGCFRRPVDLIQTLTLPLSDEQIEGAACEQLSMANFLERLTEYQKEKPNQDASAEREAQLVELARKVLPSSNEGRPRS